MLPPYVLQCAPAIGHIDGLVAYVTEVTSPVPTNSLKHFWPGGSTDQAGHSRVGSGFVPIVHGFGECSFGLRCRWHGRFIDRSHRPVPLTHILRLRIFEIVEGPEDRQPTVRIGGSKARQMGGIYYQYRVKLETYWTGLNVTHASQQQCSQQLSILQAVFDSGSHFLEQLISRGILQQPHERLDFRLESYDLGVQLSICQRDGRQLRQE